MRLRKPSKYFLLLPLSFIFSGLITAFADDAALIERGCVMNSNSWSCPKDGCTTVLQTSDATGLKEIVCNPLLVKEIVKNIYEDSHPFRYVYDAPKYLELVSQKKANESFVVHPDWIEKEKPNPYLAEKYSEESLEHRKIQLAAGLWVSSEMYKNCYMLEGSYNLFKPWGESVTLMIKNYQEAYKALTNAQKVIQDKAKADPTPQVAAIQLQIDTLRMMQKNMTLSYYINYAQVLKIAKAGAQLGLETAKYDNKNLVRIYSYDLIEKGIDESIKKAENACAQEEKVQGCEEALVGFKDIKNRLLVNYAQAYIVPRIPSMTLNDNLGTIETEMTEKINSLSDHPNYNWKYPLIGAMNKMIGARKYSGLVCPATAEKYTTSLSAFLKSVGLEENEKNKALFMNTWKDFDHFIGQPSSRIEMFTIIGNYVAGIEKFATDYIPAQDLKIKDLTQKRDKIIKALNAPAPQNLERGGFEDLCSGIVMGGCPYPLPEKAKKKISED